MSWFKVLKFFTTKDFLLHFQKKLGGEVTGGSSKTGGGMRGYHTTSMNYVLHYPNGNIKVDTGKDGLYHVKVNGETVGSDYNLKSLIPAVEKHLEL